jgi:spermidine dehydrogenase
MMEFLSTSFEDIEREVRTHLAGMLGSEGFDPALDIEAITVNRWPHGYAWFPSPISDHYEDDELPYLVGRKRFGRIAIANSDAGGEALVQCAIDQAHRAFEDLES